MIHIPKKYDFAFLIVDDTDCSKMPEICEVYDLLHENKLSSNKTVWVYPPRDFPKNYGDSLMNEDYVKWLLQIKNQGFDIGLHNVGSGDFRRSEIIQGLNEFKNKIGNAPKFHVNHSYNRDNIYSGEERFGKIIGFLVNLFYPRYSNFEGTVKSSDYFWGDYHKRTIKYSRNIELPTLDLSKYFNELPFKYENKEEYSNYWYPVAFAPNPWVWKRLVNKKSIDKLRKNRGVAIVYTHLGYYHLENGKIDSDFRDSIEYLGQNNGWYVTLDEFIQYQIECGTRPKYLSKLAELRYDIITLYTRIKYRFFIKLDDYHFKKKVGLEW